VWSNRPMDRISAWIDEKPYRFRVILLSHTAVFTCAILIAAGLFRNPPTTPPHDYAEKTLVDAHGFAEQPATSRTTRTETAGPNRSGGVSVATFRDRAGSSWATSGRVPAIVGAPPAPPLFIQSLRRRAALSMGVPQGQAPWRS
jgi:hypothetical protein